MKQKIVGTYRLGHVYVRLSLVSGIGSEFSLYDDDLKMGYIHLAADGDSWGTLLDGLLHETGEFVCTERGYRHYPSNNQGQTFDSYLFVLWHEDFSEVCGRTGPFLAACLPDLATAWKDWKAKKK